MKKNLTKKEKRALLEFKQKLLRKFGNEILELKLFGSKARGDSKNEYFYLNNPPSVFMQILKREAIPL